MIIKNGFVSNSSTSSFCLFGIGIDDEWIKENQKTTKTFTEWLNSNESK